MKLNKIEQIIKKTESECEVMEITLLSTEEYKKYQEIIPLINDWWWLRSPRYGSYCVAGVHSDGSVNYYGYNSTNSYGGVRPALWIVVPDSGDFKASDTVELFDITWTVLGVTGGQICVLADELIAHRRFDDKSNIWEQSELKKWLEEWARENFGMV